ncbi:MAG: hypothetical protein AB7R89_01545 [Dehalococcoidia bacterium]
MAEQVQQGTVYRCPVQGCGCEITVTNAPNMEATQEFTDCCGHKMEKIGTSR